MARPPRRAARFLDPELRNEFRRQDTRAGAARAGGRSALGSAGGRHQRREKVGHGADQLFTRPRASVCSPPGSGGGPSRSSAAVPCTSDQHEITSRPRRPAGSAPRAGRPPPRPRAGGRRSLPWWAWSTTMSASSGPEHDDAEVGGVGERIRDSRGPRRPAGDRRLAGVDVGDLGGHRLVEALSPSVEMAAIRARDRRSGGRAPRGSPRRRLATSRRLRAARPSFSTRARAASRSARGGRRWW